MSEWIGFAVVVSLAGALLSGMLWIGGRHQGVPRRELRRTVAVTWLAIAACVGGLVVIRFCLGGGVIEYNADAGPSLQVGSSRARVILVAAGVVWMLGWLMVALRATRRITGAPPPGREGQGKT